MRTSAIRWLACVTTALTLAACDQESSGDDGKGGEGGGQIDGGNGGEGGEGGDPGGACTELPRERCTEREDCVLAGEGCASAADADCAWLDEAQCGARADCEARTDVFGDFADCRDRTAECAALDEAACAGRNDCEWADGACREPTPLACADRGEDTCVANGCYWWSDACHAEPPPSACDQPDPASCEAAGCEWTARGCREPSAPACDTLREAACNNRPDCRWRNNRCEVDPTLMDCAELAPDTCAARPDCVWSGAGCTQRPEGACAELDEHSCNLRPDCRAIYGDGQGGGDAGEDAGEDRAPGEGGAEAPVPPPEDPPINGGFQGCEVREIRCADVPLEACPRTPGCRLEGLPCPPCECDEGGDCACLPCEAQRCVEDEAAQCGQLDPNRCAQDPRCRLVEREICDDGFDGRRAPPPPDADFAPEPWDPVCRVEIVCEAADGAGCWDIVDPQQCAARPDCQPVWGGDGNGDGACECPDADPIPCDCAPDDPNCACGRPAPPPCECFSCQPRGFEPGACEWLDQAACFNRGDCEWVDFGGGGGACGCEILPDGSEICWCEDPAPGGEGFCQPRWQGCADYGPDECAEHPECLLIEEEPFCLCEDENGDGEPDGQCPGCEPVPVCRDAFEVCVGNPAGACAAIPGCAFVELPWCEGGGGACPPGERCEVPPECEEPLECLPAAQVCPLLSPAQCDATPQCLALSVGDAYLGCAFRDQCWELNEAQCDAHPACEYLGDPQPGVCECWVDERGNEICGCDGGAPAGCAPAGWGDQPEPGEACRQDADCGPGGACWDGWCVMEDRPQP